MEDPWDLMDGDEFFQNLLPLGIPEGSSLAGGGASVQQSPEPAVFIEDEEAVPEPLPSEPDFGIPPGLMDDDDLKDMLWMPSAMPDFNDLLSEELALQPLTSESALFSEEAIQQCLASVPAPFCEEAMQQCLASEPTPEDLAKQIDVEQLFENLQSILLDTAAVGDNLPASEAETVQQPPFPEPQAEQPPFPEPQAEQPPFPEPQAEQPPSPEPQVQQPPSPELQAQQPPSPELQVQQPPSPELQAQQPPSPEPQAEQPPSPEPQAEQHREAEPALLVEDDAAEDSDSDSDSDEDEVRFRKDLIFALPTTFHEFEARRCYQRWLRGNIEQRFAAQRLEERRRRKGRKEEKILRRIQLMGIYNLLLKYQF